LKPLFLPPFSSSESEYFDLSVDLPPPPPPLRFDLSIGGFCPKLTRIG
jgi:hypothetical protein